MRALLFVMLAMVALTSACGHGSPTSPDLLDLAGNWTGTWQFVTSGVTVTDNLSVTFTQTGTAAAGTWSADSGASGVFNFPATTTVSGSMSIMQVTLSGVTCQATAGLSGSAAANSLSLQVPTIAGTTSCSWASNNVFSLHR